MIFTQFVPGWVREGERESGEAAEECEQDEVQQQRNESPVKQPGSYDEGTDVISGYNVGGWRFPGDGWDQPHGCIQLDHIATSVSVIVYFYHSWLYSCKWWHWSVELFTYSI